MQFTHYAGIVVRQDKTSEPSSDDMRLSVKLPNTLGVDSELGHHNRFSWGFYVESSQCGYPCHGERPHKICFHVFL